MKKICLFVLLLLCIAAEAKKPKQVKLPLRAGISTQWHGIKDAKCVINYVTLDSNNVYHVWCK